MIATSAHLFARPRVRLATAAMLSLYVATAAAACHDRSADPPAPVAIEWREVGTWTGNGRRQTESFEVSPTPMRLRWRIVRETAPGTARLTVTLHSAVSGRPLQTIVETQGDQSGTASVAEEPRLCHFVIDASNAEWQMTLEQAYARQPR